MTFNRRVFFAQLFRRPVEPAAVSVRVLETFTQGQEPSALLVHHADEASRDGFARWLRTNPKALVRIRDRSGNEAPATIFRVRMCFGRGLVLVGGRIQARDGDVLTIVNFR